METNVKQPSKLCTCTYLLIIVGKDDKRAVIVSIVQVLGTSYMDFIRTRLCHGEICGGPGLHSRRCTDIMILVIAREQCSWICNRCIAELSRPVADQAMNNGR